MLRRPPRASRSDTLFPYTTLFRFLRSVLRVFCGGDPIAVANAAVRLIESLLPAAPWPRRHAGTIRSARRPRLYRVRARRRSEEHKSELQSLMRISYAVFCLKKTNKNQQQTY